MAIMLLDQIQSECLRLDQAWDSDLRPDKDDTVARLDELESSARFLGADGEPVLASIVELKNRVAAE